MKNLKFLLSLLVLLFGANLQAQVEPVDKNGLAVGGYDVVAYFTGEAQVGSTDFATTHNDVTYRFATKENLETFKSEPQKYLPQFDGYCAWGVAEKGAKFPINPETFDIVDGKLYLFFNGPFNGETFNTLQPWNAETTRLMNAAHSKWEEEGKK